MEDKTVEDPMAAYSEAIIKEMEGSDFSSAEYIKIVRFIADFNNDGLTDIVISEKRLWGNAGGNWDVFLASRDGKYVFLGQLFFHPHAISIQPIKPGTSKIALYHRLGAMGGILVEYELSSAGIKEISRRDMKPNDTGNDKDRKEYENLFGKLRRGGVEEFCKLSDYIKDKNCLWEKGY